MTLLKTLVLCGLFAMPDHSHLYTLGEVVLGETSQVDFYKVFGEAKHYGSGGRSSETFSCYVNHAQPGVLVEFSLGFPYELAKVFGYEVSATSTSSTLCAATTRDLKGIASANGVALGMSRAAFKAAIQLPFVERGDALIYEQFADPNARQKQLRLTLKASFKNDALTAYAVRRYL